MKKLTKEEIEHVAYLARINLNEDEIEKYRDSLTKLLEDIDKIKEIDDYDEDELINPVSHTARLREDIEGEMLSYKEVMKNVPHSSGNFVEVPVMINE